MAPYISAKRQIKKTGHIVLADAVLLLARNEFGQDWPGKELKKFVPFYTMTKPRRKEKIFARQWLDRTKSKFRFYYEELNVPSELVDRLLSVRKILRRKLKFLIQQVVDEQHTGMEPLGPIGQDNAPIGTILRNRRNSAFCTSYILLQDKDGKVKPALLNFNAATIKNLKPKAPRAWANRAGRGMSESETERWNAAIHRFIKIANRFDFEKAGLKFAKSELAPALARRANIPLLLPSDDISTDPVKRKIVLSSLHALLKKSELLKPFLNAGGRPDKHFEKEKLKLISEFLWQLTEVKE